MAEATVETRHTIPAEIRTVALELLATVHKVREELEKNRHFVCVMFADLCDSTAYKLNRGDVDGLLKTYMHNTIVGKAVQRHNGTITKYIGDEVMATFSGENAVADGVNTGLEIQQEIYVYNQNSDRASDEIIQSKIGLHAGEVIMIRFPGHDAEDPQGKIVDAAARIIALCNKEQILCSEAVKSAMGTTVPFSDAYMREAKGTKGGLRIYEIMYDGRRREEPKSLRHSDLKSSYITDQLNAAIKDELTGHVEIADHRYDGILNQDPLHFAANHRKARLAFKSGKELAEVARLVKRGEESYPDSGSAKAQSVVVEWAQRVDSEDGEASFTDEQLEKWIGKSWAAVQCARSECELYGEIIGMNALAYVLTLRYQQTKNNEMFKEAKTICEMLETLIGDLEKRLVPAFYETYARLLSFDVTDFRSLEKAKQLAEKSRELRESEHVFETLKRLARLATRGAH